MRSAALVLFLLLATLPILAQQSGDPAADTSATDETVAAGDSAEPPLDATTTDGDADADAPLPPEHTGPPKKVMVGVALTNLGKLDLATGTYSVDFYLTFTCEPGVNDCPNEFVLDSGTVTKIDKVSDEAGRTVYRVKADMTTDLDLSEYPLDEHVLEIAFGHPTATASELIYVPDKDDTSIDAGVKLAGFDIGESSGGAKSVRYEGLDQEVSVYNFEIHIHRVRLASILKGFMPPLFIVLVSSLGLLMRPKSITNRLGMGTAGLLSAVMFHISSTSSLPPLGYLTLTDKFMLGTYVILVANIIVTVLMLVKEDRGDDAGAVSLFKKALYLIPALGFVVYLVVLTGMV